MQTLLTDIPSRPLYATDRDPDYRSSGSRVALVAEALGTPLMPWQRYVADVATERDSAGRFHYPIVVVTVPRQSGKTTLMRAIGVERAMAYPNSEVFYTAQTGKDGRERWRDLVKQLRASAFRSQITVREAAGSERVIFPNGSEFRCFAPLATALHGYTPPLVMLDEAFAHDEARGQELMGAIDPAQITIPHRQLWIVSTAGTSESGFLRRWVDAGRDGKAGVALFEWALPDDADPFDPDALASFHPAVNHRRPDGSFQMTVADLLEAAERNSRAEYERAYCNRWTVVESVLIPAERMRELAVEPHVVDAAGVVLSYDVAHDRSAGVILATWREDIDGVSRTCWRIVMAEAGSSWIAPAIKDLRAARAPLAIAADDGGPTREITDQLLRDGVPVKALSAREFSMACGSTLTSIRSGELAHDGSDLMMGAAAGLRLRGMSDGIAFSRTQSVGNIAPFVAGAVGSWVYDHRPPAAVKPRIHVAR
jgi:hypothetical protein